MTDSNIPALDRTGLRRFGLTTGMILLVIFGGLFPWLLGRPLPVWPWVLLLVLSGMALLAPMSLNPIYIGWMRFGLVASRVMTPIVLGIVFFAMITPVGLFRRMIGKDPLAKRFDGVRTYRVSSESKSVDSLKRPF